MIVVLSTLLVLSNFVIFQSSKERAQRGAVMLLDSIINKDASRSEQLEAYSKFLDGGRYEHHLQNVRAVNLVYSSNDVHSLATRIIDSTGLDREAVKKIIKETL